VLSEAEPDLAQGQQGIQDTRRYERLEFLPYLEGEVEVEDQLRDEQDKGCVREGITTITPFLSHS
jgi:hypothetical protein